jgi:GTP cyclohydrolase II
MAILPSNTTPMGGALRVERAIVELRRGRAVEVLDGEGALVVAAVERLDPQAMAACRDGDGMFRLVLTGERAEVLGVSGGGAVQLELPAGTPMQGLVALAIGRPPDAEAQPALYKVVAAEPRAGAALTLARNARLIPALLSWRGIHTAPDPERLQVSAADIAAYRRDRGGALQQVSRAKVPLAATEACEFIVYRERYGDAEHVAIVIGAPDGKAPVPVRLHSACLTGDLLASLRCDCGDQLRGAVARIVEAGGGVLLYLAQEGRGIGLANKLRAYGLQEEGLDTLQADRHLGFRADERDYTVACTMLRDLGFRQVVLLTNNPEKIAALNACDIEVVGRMSLPAPVNTHNARYLRAKREHARHLASGHEGPEER